MMGTERTYTVTELGKHNPKPSSSSELGAGETGYLVAAIKTLADVRVGDTITLDTPPPRSPTPATSPRARWSSATSTPPPPSPAAATGKRGGDFDDLRDAVEKLTLNDSSFTYQPVHSEALGFGFRCGFLGLLHMDIIQERLEREGDVEIVQTAPTVSYEVLAYNKKGDDKDLVEVHNPADLPDPAKSSRSASPSAASRS